MITKLIIALLFLPFVLLTSCNKHDPHPNRVIVGALKGPEKKLMEVAKTIAKEKYGLNVHIVVFKNYIEANKALYKQRIDANAVQSAFSLSKENDQYNYHLVSVGHTFLYPMGLYSHAITRFSDLRQGSIVAIPETSIERGLLLLQSANLITVRSKNHTEINYADITNNSKKLHITAMTSNDIIKRINQFPLVALETNDAELVGLSPSKDAIFIEPHNKHYMNIIATRQELANKPKIKKLVQAYQSKQVAEKAKQIFGSNAIPGFKL